MIKRESWSKVQKGIGWATIAVNVIVVVRFLWRPSLPWLNVATATFALTTGAYYYKGLKRDTADELSELIAMRAGYLSHQLVMGAAALMIVFGFPGDFAQRALAVFSLYVLGQTSEAAFRKLQGQAREGSAPAWAWAGLFFTIAICFFWADAKMAGNINESLGTHVVPSPL